MVQTGSRLTVCLGCKERRCVGIFWLLNPNRKIYLCANCLRAAAHSVSQAESRYPVHPVSAPQLGVGPWEGIE